LQHLNDELHRRKVVVEQHDFIQRRNLEARLGLFDRHAVATVLSAIIRIVRHISMISGLPGE
jgi:hypothetical protein